MAFAFLKYLLFVQLFCLNLYNVTNILSIKISNKIKNVPENNISTASLVPEAFLEP